MEINGEEVALTLDILNPLIKEINKLIIMNLVLHFSSKVNNQILLNLLIASLILILSF